VGLTTALGCVRDGGAFVTTETKAIFGPTRGITPEVVAVRPNAETLRELARRAASGGLTIRVAETLPVADFRRGYELLCRGGLPGRIVLTF
jgi:NADPH:quinone reductase